MLDRGEGCASDEPNLPCLCREMCLLWVLSFGSASAVDQSK